MDGTACLCPQAASWPHSRWTLWVEAAPVAQVLGGHQSIRAMFKATMGWRQAVRKG